MTTAVSSAAGEAEYAAARIEGTLPQCVARAAMKLISINCTLVEVPAVDMSEEVASKIVHALIEVAAEILKARAEAGKIKGAHYMLEKMFPDMMRQNGYVTSSGGHIPVGFMGAAGTPQPKP